MYQGEGMGLDHIRELLFERRSSRLVLFVSDLVSDREVLVVSAVELTGPRLRLGLIVLLKGASPIDLVHPFCARVRWCLFLLQHSRVKELYFSPSSRSWNTLFNQACPSMVSKWMPSVFILA